MHTNALIDEKSPYLRQHAHNPVNWLPWGEAAFEKARKEDKPIFLSIGYSTCHWCHVMAHESFEDEAIAELLNRDFVPVKLDREERPDVDRVYMLFVQASTGSGGWPMSVWLTPERKPFYGGTYFPPNSRYGRPGFREVLGQLARVWKEDRQRVEDSSDNVAEQLRSLVPRTQVAVTPDRELFASAFGPLRRSFDPKWGGFGGAPKFPRPVLLNYLLRYHALDGNPEALEMVTQTLNGMAAGGMHDQLGGGFHRYSVDERWFVPHFEKMLYDQAQLTISYLEAYQITGEARYSNVARGIFEYVLRDLTDVDGGFYSAEDADSADPENPSHHGEGAFYIWRKAELDGLLGKDSDAFCKYFGVLPEGNVEADPQGEFAGRNILFRAEAGEGREFESARAALLATRGKRPRPHLDNKILTSWNALFISALCKGYRVLDDLRYLAAARRATEFLLAHMYQPEGAQLLRRFCEAEAAIGAFLDDYAFLAQALLDLFEATSETRYLEIARSLAVEGFARFEDHEAGGFFSTEQNARDLLLRVKDDYDGAEPSGNSVATDVLLRLAHLAGDETLRKKAMRSLESFAPKIKAQSTMAPQMLVALARSLAAPEQIVLRCAEEEMGTQCRELFQRESHRFSSNTVVLALSDAAARSLRRVSPFLGNLERKGKISVYRCRDFACELPEIIG
jgi:uncharacterized protein YyaL (SSP411 family)